MEFHNGRFQDYERPRWKSARGNRALAAIGKKKIDRAGRLACA